MLAVGVTGVLICNKVKPLPGGAVISVQAERQN